MSVPPLTSSSSPSSNNGPGPGLIKRWGRLITSQHSCSPPLFSASLPWKIPSWKEEPLVHAKITIGTQNDAIRGYQEINHNFKMSEISFLLAKNWHLSCSFMDLEAYWRTQLWNLRIRKLFLTQIHKKFWKIKLKLEIQLATFCRK